MKIEFDRKKHIEQHKMRIAKIRKDIRDRKIIEILKDEIRQRRKGKDG